MELEIARYRQRYVDLWVTDEARTWLAAHLVVPPAFASVEDMTERTRSPDFEGRHSHRAWRLSSA